MARKFIISEDKFIMGNVELHMDLIPRQQPNTHNNPFHKAPKEEPMVVLGGGRWETDNDNKILYLWGASTDYGYAEPEKIKHAIASPETWISQSMTGWQIKHAPIIINTLPDLSAFVDLMLVPE